MDFTELLKIGLEAQQADLVNESNIASSRGSGSLPVYATPAMIALMENASHSAVDKFLPQGWSTVGTELNITHIAATPMGMKVSAKAKLLEIDGRALAFKVEAFDETGKIGEGSHKRFIIEDAKFMAKTESKKTSS